MTQDNGSRALAERLCASRAPAVTPTGDMFVDDECRALAAAILANGAAFLPDAAEFDRLRRIEAAARALPDWLFVHPFENPETTALRAALYRRPTPHALWQQADGNRDEYLRLMREHGHRTPPALQPEGSARDGG